MVKRLLGVGAVALLMACGSGTEPEVGPEGALVTAATEVTLEYGQEIQLGGTIVRLVLADVPEDSRCPVDATCVWEGNAVVEVGVTVGSGPTVPLQMNSSLEPRFASWGEIGITLLELTPVPTSSTPIRMEDYAARVRVEPVNVLH